MKKVSLTRQQKIVVLGSGILLIGLTLLFAVYFPVGSRLKKGGEELSSLQSELKEAREAMASAKEIPFYLPEQKEVSLLMEEITGLGKGLGIDFRSIRPQPVEETSFGYQLLPVELRLESSYRELGLFMGSLRKLKRGLVIVENFQIDREGAAFPHLNCRLSVKIALRP